MQNRTIRRLWAPMMVVLIVGGCELQGPVGNDKDAAAGVLLDSASAGEGTADLPVEDAPDASDASTPQGWVIQVGGDKGGSIWEVAIDKAGDLILLGTFNGTMKLDGVNGEIKRTSGSSGSTFIGKLDPGLGKWHWAEAVDGVPMSLGETLTDGLGIDAAGNIYHAGQFKGTAIFGAKTLTSAGDLDIFVTKRAPDGKVVRAVSAGGAGKDVASALAVGSDGRITICGYISSTAAFGSHSVPVKGDSDLFVARLDAAAKSFDWAVGAGSGSTGIAIEHALALQVDASGNSLITGEVVGSAGEAQAYVAKVDPNGTFRWAAGLGGRYGISIARNKGGDIFVLGGDHFGSSPPAQFVPKNVLMVARGYEHLNSWQLAWPPVFTIGQGTVLAGYRLLVDDDGDSVVSGIFTGNVQLGPKTLTSSSTGWSGFLASWSATGEIKPGALAISSTGGSATAGMARDKTGGLYVVGQFTGTANIGGTSLTSRSASSLSDGFVWYMGRGPNTF